MTLTKRKRWRLTVKRSAICLPNTPMMRSLPRLEQWSPISGSRKQCLHNDTQKCYEKTHCTVGVYTVSLVLKECSSRDYTNLIVLQWEHTRMYTKTRFSRTWGDMRHPYQSYGSKIKVAAIATIIKVAPWNYQNHLVLIQEVGKLLLVWTSNSVAVLQHHYSQVKSV